MLQLKVDSGLHNNLLTFFLNFNFLDMNLQVKIYQQVLKYMSLDFQVMCTLSYIIRSVLL